MAAKGRDRPTMGHDSILRSTWVGGTLAAVGEGAELAERRSDDAIHDFVHSAYSVRIFFSEGETEVHEVIPMRSSLVLSKLVLISGLDSSVGLFCQDTQATA